MRKEAVGYRKSTSALLGGHFPVLAGIVIPSLSLIACVYKYGNDLTVALTGVAS